MTRRASTVHLRRSLFEDAAAIIDVEYGEALTIELTVWPARTRNVLTFSAFMRDIGQRKQAETELRAAKELRSRWRRI